MEKRKRWQLFLILIAIALTIYNILPTVFYYTKPLNSPITESRAKEISISIMDRVNALEKEATSWLKSYCKLLNIKPSSIEIAKDNPEQIRVKFSKQNDADRLRTYLPRAGSLIPFVPSQLGLIQTPDETSINEVLIQRKIPIQFEIDKAETYFSFSKKRDENGEVSPFYKKIIFDRAAELGTEIGGISEPAPMVTTILEGTTPAASQDLLYALSNHILGFVRVFGEDSPISARFFSHILQGNFSNPSRTVSQLTQAYSQLRDELKLERIQLEKKEQDLKQNSGFLQEEDRQKLRLIERKEKNLAQTESLLKNHSSQLLSAKRPWTYASILEELEDKSGSDFQSLSLGSFNPFVESLQIDWNNDQIVMKLHPDLVQFKKQLERRNETHLQDAFDQLLINEVARLSRQSGEQIALHPDELTTTLNELTGSQSILVLKLWEIAKQQAEQTQSNILENWQPSHPELSRDVFPVSDYQTYQSLPPEQRGLCLVVYAPAYHKSLPPGMRADSTYVIAKGLDRILQKYQVQRANQEAQDFLKDFYALQTLLKENGFIGYPGSSFPYQTEFSQDFVFEKSDAFHNIIAATREDFHIRGTKQYAMLEFTNVEQRLLALNKIETRIQEDLLKARDDYASAQVSLNEQMKFDVPPPSKNAFLSNLALSLHKYFRGDERKVLHWGLDLSGGKTVQIELRDQHNHKVTDEADLKQGVNELFNRVNKMGVSEVSIRTEGSNIVLDFPGSQGLSASELIKASSMFFHVVNEKFTPSNTTLADSVNQFLQEVWNEAVVTNRKDAASINSIAWKHLYGDSLDPEVVHPRNEAAKILYENGLRLTSPFDTDISSNFNDSVSKIAVLRGDDFTEWQGQSHPLLIIFRNYTLEGSNLENITASYDPSKGNFLSFEVKGSHTSPDGARSNPREDLHAWTSQFSKEKITGTPLETFTNGRGWRMAVILNETVISSPALDSALRDRAMITGSFSQREINQLSADLKAGSLTYTPRILSEKNVSPELGQHDRAKGIFAMTIALILVIVAMISYYRFAGLIASIAVLFNLLIMWATLQNLGVTLSLAGIAGIILTVGMAVDANVLVFERIKEELAVSKRLASAVHAGYRKAFSAIIDSNVTTIIAALILLHFDSGPIKGFAVTLIIGIASSMFTALFMTRYFFAGWAQNPKNKTLKMANFIRSSKFNFLKWGKTAFLVSAVIIVLGSFTLIQKKNTIFGMDFTGGFALNLELVAEKGVDYRQETEDALIKAGLDPQDFQIRELNPSNNLRILLSTTLDQEGRPFEGMPLLEDKLDVTYPYENNPRIAWVVNALEDAGLKLNERELTQLDKNWTAMSGQMSESMRNNATIGLLLALIAILIYLTFRFEFKFSISAMICTLHDVLISVGFIALLNFLGVPVQIDLHTVAALMTIIGYSLNDTIIIFDRIREDMKVMRKSSLSEIVNHSLNITLSRTTITSGTTFLALIALVFLGGSTIFNFALVMAVGVIFGTLSSLFIASPLMLLFHRKENSDQKNKNYVRQGN